MLNDLPPLPPIRKPSNGKNYEVNNDIFTVPGQMTEESEFLASIDTVQCSVDFCMYYCQKGIIFKANA